MGGFFSNCPNSSASFQKIYRELMPAAFECYGAAKIGAALAG